MRPPNEFLDRFEKVKELRDDRWEACCPAHPDTTPSLSIRRKPNGDWLLHCHAGCVTDDVLEAIKLEKRDLFAESSNGNGYREIVATYDYTDEQGGLLYQVVRFHPKDFRQRKPDGSGGWEWKLNGVRRVVYRLPRVVEAVERGEDVMVVEGEGRPRA
jgi:putative DNA primase/helicase